MERKQWEFGGNLVEFQPPDVFYLHFRTRQVPDSAREAMAVIDQTVAEIGRMVLIVVILGDDVSFPAETRKYYASINPQWRKAIVVGGSLALRAALNVILRAMGLLGGKGKVPPTKFVKTLDEAQAAIAEIRKSEEEASAAKA